MKSSAPRTCRNCHRVHQIADHEPTDCFYITIRRSGRSKLHHSDHTHSILIPQSTNGQRKLKTLIWDSFESIKVENDFDRDQLATEEHTKGHLRVKAPIPWLSWAGTNGRSGQTRSSANFQTIWETHVEHAKYRPVWLTSPLLTEDLAEDVEAEIVEGSRSRSDSWQSGSQGCLSTTSSSSDNDIYAPFPHH
jgi:hypothetical protein